MLKEYGLYCKNDFAKFNELCLMIERDFPDFQKDELLTDVDGSKAQTYTKGTKEIVIVNDYDYECIVARANVDLTDFVSKIDTGFKY